MIDFVLYVIISFATFTIEIWSRMVEDTISLKRSGVRGGESFRFIYTRAQISVIATLCSSHLPRAVRTIFHRFLHSISCRKTDRVGRR